MKNIVCYNHTTLQLELQNNYTTTKAWKYTQLINIMPCEKTKELYYSCNLVANGTLIQCNVFIIYINIVNHFEFGKLQFSYA